MFNLSEIFDKELKGKKLIGFEDSETECNNEWEEDVDEYGEDGEPEDCQCEYCIDSVKFGKIIKDIKLGWDKDHDPLIVLIMEDDSTINVYESNGIIAKDVE